ncbi:methyltransferase [Sediminicola sp. 1XM1-17]|uniref:methyltransferase n=1 Tax=Sediminicola sp. 1XM1-17 TaxID=3127702 RepID=UPI00307887D1
METRTKTELNPSKIIETGMGFWASKTLLTAVNLGLFTLLAKGPLPAAEIKEHLGLHDRSLYDFLDTLVALGFLKRKGLGETAMYSNTKETDHYLDKNKTTYIGGMLVMSNNRLYPFWNNLEDALKTGLPQNEVKNGNMPFFDILYANEQRLRQFMSAMGGFQMANFIAFSKNFDFSNYKTLCDIGGAGCELSMQVSTHHPHMECISFDLPRVSEIAKEKLDEMDFSPRIKIVSGNFFNDDFPNVDMITMGNILHDWGTRDKKLLISKAYQALPKGGALVILENMIDEERKKNVFGLLMSLNMLIETYEGYDFTPSQFDTWAKGAGFQRTEFMPLAGPTSAAIAYK